MSSKTSTRPGPTRATTTTTKSPKSSSAQPAAQPRRTTTAAKIDGSKGPSRDTSQCGSPTKSEGKKLPPIKAPVGLAKGPDLKNVKSKIGSLNNVQHKAAVGERKVITRKLEWKAKPKIGSLDNAKHVAGGGEVKVESMKLDWKTGSKVGSLDNMKHKAGGGDVTIFEEKYATGTRSSSRGRGPSESSAGGDGSVPPSPKPPLTSTPTPTPTPRAATSKTSSPPSGGKNGSSTPKSASKTPNGQAKPAVDPGADAVKLAKAFDVLNAGNNATSAGRTPSANANSKPASAHRA